MTGKRANDHFRKINIKKSKKTTKILDKPPHFIAFRGGLSTFFAVFFAFSDIYFLNKKGRGYFTLPFLPWHYRPVAVLSGTTFSFLLGFP